MLTPCNYYINKEVYLHSLCSFKIAFLTYLQPSFIFAQSIWQYIHSPTSVGFDNCKFQIYMFHYRKHILYQKYALSPVIQFNSRWRIKYINLFSRYKLLLQIKYKDYYNFHPKLFHVFRLKINIHHIVFESIHFTIYFHSSTLLNIFEHVRIQKNK